MSRCHVTMLRIVIAWAAVFVCLGLAREAHCESTPERRQFVVGSIQLLGLTRTQESYVLSELGFSVGQTVDEKRIQTAAQRLRNTNFFQSVDVALESENDGSMVVKLLFQEKWTLTPVLRGGTGGGVDFFVLGVYDLNLLGRGIEAGGQFEQFAGAPGGSLWWRQPFASKPHWRFMCEFQFGQRPVFYLNPRSDVYHTPLAKKTRLFASVQRRISRFEFGLGLELLERELLQTLEGVLEDYPDFTTRNESGLNSKIFYRINTINLFDYLWDGHKLEMNVGHFFPTGQDQHRNILAYSMNSTHFWRVGARHNLGLRVQVQRTTGSSLLSLIRMGSLDSVRGLDDGERIGQWSWVLNAEERWLTFVNEVVVLQTVLFTDAGNAGKSLQEWTTPVAASAGVGLRLGFRPIARLRLRADYAHSLNGLRRTHSWVVGMQHYF